MATPDRAPAFTSETARDQFLSVYDHALDQLWPVPVDALDVPTRAGHVRVYRAGPAEGEPVVLLPGSGGNALSWYRYLEPLARTRPVLAVDPLGEPGRSVQTQPITTGADIGNWLTDVLTALDLDGAQLVGSSFGGWTAMEQHLGGGLGGGGRVAALTLVDPAGFAVPTRRFYRWIIFSELAGLLPRRLRHRAADRLVNGTLREDVLMTLVLASRHFRRRLPYPPVYTDEQLRAVTVPVQVLLGERSALHDSQAVAARLADAVPTWRVETVPGTGHALPLEAPELVIDRILNRPSAPLAREG